MHQTNDLYQPLVERTVKTLQEMGRSSFERSFLTGAMNFSGTVASAVIYRMVRDGLVTETKVKSSHYRPTRPGSGLSSTASKTRVTFTLK